MPSSSLQLWIQGRLLSVNQKHNTKHPEWQLCSGQRLVILLTGDTVKNSSSLPSSLPVQDMDIQCISQPMHWGEERSTIRARLYAAITCCRGNVATDTVIVFLIKHTSGDTLKTTRAFQASVETSAPVIHLFTKSIAIGLDLVSSQHLRIIVRTLYRLSIQT